MTNLHAETMRGVTLIELMVTLSVLAITVTMGVPAFLDLINNNKATGITNSLVSALNFGRSEAVKRGQLVTVCTSNSTASATPGCDGTSWKSGWVVFVDSPATGVVDGTDVVLKVGQVPNVPSGTSFTGDANLTGYVSFKANGQSQDNAASTTGGNLTLCLSGKKRTIGINTTGRIHVDTGTC